jgi:Tol biopolymer transport system component
MKVSQRASIVIAIGVLAAAFIFAPANVAGASVPTNGRIAFASARFPADVSGPDIYTMDPNGTNVIGPLTPGFADSNPAWSPDGTKIAYDTTNDPYNNAIYVMNADGTGKTKIVNAQDTNPNGCCGPHDGNQMPAWSADGTRLAFSSEFGGLFWQIATVGSDGKGIAQLTSGASDNYFPSWSPDGTKIAFESNRGGNYDIYTMNTDGTGVTQLTTDAGGDELPSWSPDGTKIAFDSSRGGNGSNIYVMNANGTNVQQLTSNSSSNAYPTWSPDGTMIAFASDRDLIGDTHDYEIYTMNADGTDQTRITSSAGYDLRPSWGAGPVVGSSDTQAPVVAITLSGPNGGVPDGHNGWFVTGPVTGRATADDSTTGGSAVTSLDCGSLALTTSGVGTPSASGSFSIPTDGVTHISCTASDSRGNTSAPVLTNVNLDTAAPSLARIPAADSCSSPGDAGWCRFKQTAGFTASDATSGIASLHCTAAPGTSCDFTNVTATQGAAVFVPSGSVCDVAGNCNAGIAAGPFQLDAIAPSIVRNPAADSCSSPGNAGWCRLKQTAGFTASDATSGIESPNCTVVPGALCNITNVTQTQGAAVSVPSGAVCDIAGNCNAGIDAGPFKLDAIGPTLAPTVGPAQILLAGTGTTAANPTDAVSGVASQSCAAVDTSTAGVNTVACTATDIAGNSATTSAQYLVEYRLAGFLSPARSSDWRRGKTVPVRVQLTNAAGTRISDSEAGGLLSPTCRVRFTATGVQSASACMTYDSKKHQFAYDLALGQATGNATLNVTVTYPGTTKTTSYTETIIVTR